MREQTEQAGGGRAGRGRAGRALLALMLLACAGSAAAEDSLPLYFEWGPPLYDYLDLGGEDIDPYEYCSNAGGSFAVGGFDMIGEWIEILFTLPETGDYEVGTSFKSFVGLLNDLELSLRPAAGGGTLSTAISYYGAGTG